jgi:hypothetical protein
VVRATAAAIAEVLRRAGLPEPEAKATIASIIKDYNVQPGLRRNATKLAVTVDGWRKDMREPGRNAAREDLEIYHWTMQDNMHVPDETLEQTQNRVLTVLCGVLEWLGSRESSGDKPG